jgi:hypothetical protein
MRAAERFAGTATAEKSPARLEPGPPGAPSPPEEAFLSQQWRHLSRVATAVAILTSPVLYVWFHDQVGLGRGLVGRRDVRLGGGLRGLVDIVVRSLIPWPTLFGQDDVRVSWRAKFASAWPREHRKRARRAGDVH